MRAQVRLLADGRRLHLQDGPIDLILEAFGPEECVRTAYAGATRRFATILEELCAELPQLRRPVRPGRSPLRGPVARRMHRAVAPHAEARFITPMAAVAGAVAEEILATMTASAALPRAYVNNGGDIALHLAPAERFTIGLAARPDHPGLFGTTCLSAQDPVRGIATSGWRGRSFSLGIADAVTILAATASEADAAATMVANAVDLQGHPAVRRARACDIQPDSDLGHRLVTRQVGVLAPHEIETALDFGAGTAQALVGRGSITAAALHLQGRTRVIGLGPKIGSPAHRESDAGHRRFAHA